MKFDIKKILGILLLITLIFSAAGIKIRMANESHNTSVVTAVDYREFKKMADLANEDIEDVLSRLKQNGVSQVAVKEVSLRDMEYNGDIKLSTFGELRSELKTQKPDQWQELRKVVGKADVSPVHLTARTNDPEVAVFLKENLAKRFKDSELITAQIDQTNYFIINAEILQPPKTMKKEYPRDVLVGFDQNVLKHLSKNGFEIVLSPGNTTGSNYAYIEEYDELVKEYGVKYLVINGEVSGNPDNLELMEKLVEDNNLIIGIIETPVQLGYLEQKGLNEVIGNTGYQVNRLYSTRNDEFLKDVNERYYRWVRAVVDRGIRIVYVVPFEDNKLTYTENLDNTIETIGKFHKTMEEKGFSIDKPLNHLSTATTDKFDRFMVSLSLLLAGVLYLIYLFDPSRRFTGGLLLLGIIGCAGANLVLDMDLSKINALAAAILYPSLSSLLLLIYLRDNRKKSFLVQIVSSLAIILGINALGMYTIVTSLADIRYIMNIEYFRGVKLAFLLPLLLFIVNYLSCFAREEGFIKFTEKYLRMKPNYLVLLLLGIGAMGLYYYLARSGHTAGVSVSPLEIKTREVLESIFLARPRFKEIIIGYPALITMVYLYKKYKYDVITLVFGLGVVMGSISMVNSFAHVFTAVVISINRTLAGLLTGMVIGIGVLAGIIILEQIYLRFIAPRMSH